MVSCGAIRVTYKPVQGVVSTCIEKKLNGKIRATDEGDRATDEVKFY